MLKLKKLAAIVLTIATISTSTVSLNSVQAYAKGKEKAKVTEKQELKTYNSTYGLEDTKMGMKFIANAKFIEDPADNQKTVFLSTDGSFINSNLKRFDGYYKASMNWPSSYECSIEVKDTENSGGETQIVSSTPTNTIKSARVSNTVGYSVGGNISVMPDKATGTVNATYNQSQNISYDQENYFTVQNVNNLHKTNWKVQFGSTLDGYDIHSYTSLYGNEMFMLSRSYNAGTYNLTPDDKLPALITGGFSPNFLVALKAPKDKKESIVEVTFKRHIDKYELAWIQVRWFGNAKHNADERVATKKFVINWENHTILPVSDSNQ
ncbi:leukocidin family pore-forming toxin [Clostridium tarantellae]|uniref:Alpha hemolysin n=1 Tax=Clostridium tarantellae TaxID=39493 RepID=A0A6I1MPK2_9CLOT|nr:leukocidin family pore-forming toxin [Clostridium tarantellae]MPQ44850.1 alpha hemolysin [Clostridium tarantellae]